MTLRALVIMLSVLAATAVAVVGQTCHWWQQPTREKRATSNDGRDQIADMQEQIATLREELRFSGGVAALAASAVTAPAASNRPEADKAKADSVGARAMQPRVTEGEFRERLGEVFHDEKRDSVWGREAQVTARAQVMDRLPKDSALTSLECRSTMCRAEITHQDSATYRNYTKQMLSDGQRPWQGPIMGGIMKNGSDGKVTSEIYYVKTGEDPGREVAAQLMAESGGSSDPHN